MGIWSSRMTEGLHPSNRRFESYYAHQKAFEAQIGQAADL